MGDIGATETAILETDAIIHHSAGDEGHAAAGANATIEIPILASIQKVRARVGVTQVAAPTRGVQERAPAFLALGVFDVNLLQIQLVESPQAELKGARQLRFLRGG